MTSIMEQILIIVVAVLIADLISLGIKEFLRRRRKDIPVQIVTVVKDE
jgi:hypothetical protein